MRYYLVSSGWNETRAQYTEHRVIVTETARAAAEIFDPTQKPIVADPTEKITRLVVRLLPKNTCIDGINSILRLGQNPDCILRRGRVCYYD